MYESFCSPLFHDENSCLNILLHDHVSVCFIFKLLFIENYILNTSVTTIYKISSQYIKKRNSSKNLWHRAAASPIHAATAFFVLIHIMNQPRFLCVLQLLPVQLYLSPRVSIVRKFVPSSWCQEISRLQPSSLFFQGALKILYVWHLREDLEDKLSMREHGRLLSCLQRRLYNFILRKNSQVSSFLKIGNFSRKCYQASTDWYTRTVFLIFVWMIWDNYVPVREGM